MAYTQQEIMQIKQLLSSIIGEIRPKSYFSYYGFCKGESLFALLKNKKFYLYIPNELVESIIPHHNITLLEDSRVGIYSKNFYHIPEHLMNNIDLLSEWIQYTIQVLKQKSNASEKRIRHLPNMNISTERILRKLGISSIEDLIEKGEIEIFIELLKKGIDADKSLLFRLHGAIKHQLIYTLTPSEKNNLLLEANKALYEAGIRKKFQVQS